MCLTFKTCCCCVSLEVGAQIISIVSTVVSAALVLVYGTAASVLRQQEPRAQFYLGLAVLAGCQALLGSLLAYGVFMKSPRLLWPWSVFCWCKSSALLALCVLGAAALAGAGGGQLAPDAGAMISFYFIYSVVLFYCACVVNSRRLQLLREPYPDYLPTLALSAAAYPYPVKP